MKNSLININNVKDFSFAVSGGVNINSVYKGRPLIKHFFTNAMRRLSFKPNETDINMEKFKILANAGAKMDSLFYYSPVEEFFDCPDIYYRYEGLVRENLRQLQFWKIILENEQAKKIIMTNKDYWEELKKLNAEMEKLCHAIAEIIK